jgi:hypothetical protein
MADRFARELLGSRSLARLAYTAVDGSPRAIPIGFAAADGRVCFYTEPSTPKVQALRRDPRVAVTIDVQGPPPRVLLLRGRVELDTRKEHIDRFLEMSRRGTYADEWDAFEAGVRALYDEMTEISLVPDWAKVLDFETRAPETIMRLAREKLGAS